MDLTKQDPNPLSQAPSVELQKAQAERLRKAWELPKGLRYWTAVNNTEVGLWYTSAAMIFFAFGGVLALLMRIQLAFPGNTFVSADLYNQIFTLHGSVMMFLFAVPIFEAFSIMLMPQMLGARDLPFPRLSAYGFWGFVIGGSFLCGSIFFDAAPRGGWFMYPPLTTGYQSGIGNDMWLLGFSFIEVAAIAAAVELIVGVLKTRPPGMRINLMPLYGWYVLVAAAMVLFAFPPLIAGSMMMEMERAFQWPFYDATRGGDPLLWQHLFWIFGHPDVYIIFLPAVALVAMIVPTFARRPIVGYSWIVLAAVGTGFISFGLWVHHMFTTGLPGISLGLFSAASEAVAIPTGVQLFCFIATIYLGRVVSSVPMLFVFGGVASFVIGGLTGVMVAVAPFDFQAHDSFFIVGHMHYVLIGGTIFPVVAGFYYFYPLALDKKLSDRLGAIAFWLMFTGFNLAFFPMHLTGLLGMPRRVFTYPAGLGWDLPNLISTVGAFILAAGLGVFFWDLVRPKGRDPLPPRNPWNAGTLEWVAEVPGENWGIRSIPEIDSRYPIWEQPNFLRDIDEGRFYLPDAEELKRETLVTTPVDANPTQCLRVLGPTVVPILTAICTAGVFIFPTYKLWWPALASCVLTLGSILYWLWNHTAIIPERPHKPVGLGLTLPTYVSGTASVGWWAMFITMLGDMAAYASLLFGYFFYWSLQGEFAPAGALVPGATLLLAGAAALLVSWGLTQAAVSWNRANHATAFYIGLGAAAILTIAGGCALVAGPWFAGLAPTANAYAAIVWLLIVWTTIHTGIGAVMQLYCLARRAAGRMTAEYDIDMHNVALFWHFLALTVASSISVIVGFPLLL